MRSSSVKVGLLDKPLVLPWIYQDMVNLEVSGIFFGDAFLEYKSKECVFQTNRAMTARYIQDSLTKSCGTMFCTVSL